jgi:hypothetical protein
MLNARDIRIPQFFRRKNQDATFDSVCGFCYYELTFFAPHSGERLPLRASPLRSL